MKSTNFLRAHLFLLAAWATLWSGSLSADTHIIGRAVGTNQNDKLLVYNAEFYDINSGYKMAQAYRTNGLNAGYFRGDVLTFTCDSAEDINPNTGRPTGQLLGRALFGSFVAVQVVSVDGPPGGSFAFWAEDGEDPGPSITFSLPVGTTGATNWIIVSESNGAPNSNPYGHIHGRAFTTTLPGLYTVGFRLIDVSTNGVGGGPLHSPSDVFMMYFQAGPSVENIVKVSNGFRVNFRSAPGVTNVLEAADSPATNVWTQVAGPLRGNSNLQFLTDTNPPGPARFYRLRILNTPP